MSAVSTIVADPRYWPAVTFLGGLVLGSFVDALARRFDRRSPNADENGYVETRLKLRLDQSGSRTLVQVAEKNIHAWQQNIVDLDFKDSEGNSIHAENWRNDTLSVTFKRPVDYERPIIDTFGHQLTGMTFYPLGTRGAVFQFYGGVKVGAIEIWFPPPGYYAKQSAESSFSVGLESQPQQP